MTGAQLLFWILALGACGGAIAVVIAQNVVRMAFWLIVSLGSVAGLFFQLHADFVGATQLLIYVGGTVVLLIFGVMLTASGPFLKIKTSTAELLLSAGIGGLVFVMLYTAVAGVDWNRAGADVIGAGRIPRDQFEEFVAGLEASDRERLESLYMLDESTDDPVYRLPPGRLSASDRDFLVAAWNAQERLNRPPAAPEGGTARPIGLSLVGLRPDRDLGADADSRLSTGYLLPFEIISVHLLVVLIGAAYLARAKRRTDAGGAP
ncbi:MAG TPA: NADH-quinone oxidoreductase subunit J [Planctomycetaceae bacterium]|nr:NADH-quinone oxidoreductase subunit J [Planctomycetaceae bacterium]